MSKISGKETKPEIVVRKYLYSSGFRYRKNDKRYPGKPDIILPKYRTAIFINGCFWHGHNCKFGKFPSRHKDFWETKINNTIKRDKGVHLNLIETGWHVIVVWQCELRNLDIRRSRLKSLVDEIKDRPEFHI